MFINFDKAIIERIPDHVDSYKLTVETGETTIVYPRVCFKVNDEGLNLVVLEDNGTLFSMTSIEI